MGRNWSRKNKKKKEGKGGRDGNDSKKNNPDWGKERDPYCLVQTGNFKMEAFYAYQGIHNSRAHLETTAMATTDTSFVECSTAAEKESERQRWLTSMKSILPTSFRIGNDVDPDLRDSLKKELEEFLGKKMRIEVEPKGGTRRLQREQQDKEQQKKEDSSNDQDPDLKEAKPDAEHAPLEKEIKFIAPARKIPFIPHGYQVSIDKQTLRRNTAFKPFHNWLKVQTEAGFVTRQEAVSMIPPIVLDPKPHHVILDMAAAPGSKTSQLLEIVNLPTDKDCHEPVGCVVANDADVKRAYMLVHQMRRINSPAVFITSCDARFFPLLRSKDSESTGDSDEGIFDRVLCDVPCSGDGTTRKNPGVWKNWTCLNGYALHPLQLAIALRGAQSTKVGGYLCYSTCSMNPIENEAVVAELLRASEGSLELVERKSELTGLVSRPGMDTWTNLSEVKSALQIKNQKKKNNAKMVARREEWAKKNKAETEETACVTEASNDKLAPDVLTEIQDINKDTEKSEVEPMKKEKVSIRTTFQPNSMDDKVELKKLVESAGMFEFSSYDEVPDEMRKRIRSTCFPPTPEEISKFNLKHCMRILPQDMDTGGFFVALLKKVAPFNARTRKRFEALQVEDFEKQNDSKGTVANAKKINVDEGDSEPKIKKAKIEDASADVPADVSADVPADVSAEENMTDVEQKVKREMKRTFIEEKDGRKSKTIGKDDFVPVSREIFEPLKEYYGLDDENFKFGQYFVRAGGDSKVLYFVTNSIKTHLIDKGLQEKVTVINTGLKGFVRNNKECEVGYRVAQEGVHFVAPHMTKRKISANLKDFELCLSAPSVQIKDFSDEFAAKTRDLTMGSFVVTLEGFENDYLKKLVICLWKCRSETINYLVTQAEIDGIRSKIRSIAKRD